MLLECTEIPTTHCLQPLELGTFVPRGRTLLVYWIFTDSPMSNSHKLEADPIRDLNNFLQGLPEGTLTKDLLWFSSRQGPENDALYHVTAVCKHSHFDEASPPFLKTFVQQSGE